MRLHSMDAGYLSHTFDFTEITSAKCVFLLIVDE